MNILKKTKQFCQFYKIKPKRSMGQNFLIKESVYQYIIKSAELNKNDIVLEIGPGLGFLTIELARLVKKVVAVEIDDKLSKIVRNNLKLEEIKNVNLINKDIFKISQLEMRKILLNNTISYKIVANLPYNISSRFLRKFLSAKNKPKIMILLLQKEVAERIIAKPGKLSLLGISVQFYVEPEIIKYVSSNCFFPKPKVDSAIIKCKIRNKKYKYNINEKEFFRLVRIGFASKRKTLANNLSAGYYFSKEKSIKLIKELGFNSKIRAQELSVNNWIELLKKL